MAVGPVTQEGPDGPAQPPPGGYSVPWQQPTPQFGFDPLISPDYGGWWQRGTGIVKRGWKPLALLQGIAVAAGLAFEIPVEFYSALAARDLPSGTAARTGMATTSELSAYYPVFGFTILGTFASALIAAIVMIAMFHVVVMMAVGARPDLGVALSAAAHRLLPLVGWQLLAGLIMLCGTCACVLPGLYFGAVFLVLPAVVAFERGGVIVRCFRLFNAGLGPSLARVATVIGLTVGVALVAMVPAGIIDLVATQVGSGTTGVAVGSIIAAGLAALAGGALAILTAPLTLTTYADMRARVEPLSTGVLAQELGLAAPR